VKAPSVTFVYYYELWLEKGVEI